MKKLSVLLDGVALLLIVVCSLMAWHLGMFLAGASAGSDVPQVLRC